MRLLKFISLFLGVAILILGSVVGLNWTAFDAVFENRTALAEGSEFVPQTYSLSGLNGFIAEHPEFASVYSLHASQTDSNIDWQSEQLRVMGSISHLQLLIAYAKQVDDGAMDPDRLVSWSQIDRFHISGIQQSIFDANRRKRVLSGIALRNVVDLALIKNDEAAADFLYFFLSPDSVKATNSNHLGYMEPFVPWSGYYISKQTALSEHVSSSPKELALLFAENPNFRKNVLDAFEGGLNRSFFEERALYGGLPKAKPKDLVALLKQALKGQLINNSISALVIEHLERAPESQSMSHELARYGALFDTRLGQLSGIDFGTSAFTNDTYIQAVFFDQLPIGMWFHMSSNYMNQDFQQRLIWDPFLRQNLRDSLAKKQIMLSKITLKK